MIELKNEIADISIQMAEKIIKKLKFKSNQTIISFISTITLVELKKMIKVKAKIDKSDTFTSEVLEKRDQYLFTHPTNM